MLRMRGISVIAAYLFMGCGSATSDNKWVFVNIPFWPAKVDYIKIKPTVGNLSGNLVEVKRDIPGFAFTIPADSSGGLDISASGYISLNGCQVTSGHLYRPLLNANESPVVGTLNLNPTYPINVNFPLSRGKIGCNSWLSLSPAQDDVRIQHIWGVDDTHIWMAGNNYQSAGSSNGIMMYWDGTFMRTLFQLPSDSLITSMIGASSGQILLGTSGGVQKWNGLRLAPVNSPPPPITAMWGKDENDYWVVNVSDVHQWNGTGWLKHGISQVGPGKNKPVNKLYGRDNQNVWAIRENEIFYWNGINWQYQCGASLPTVIWGTSARFAWAGGLSRFYQWDGLSWEDRTGVYDFHPTAMVGFGENMLIAVGHGFARTANGQYVGKTIVWDGIAWYDNFRNSEVELTAIWARDAEHIYAADAKGRLLRCVNVN